MAYATGTVYVVVAVTAYLLLQRAHVTRGWTGALREMAVAYALGVLIVGLYVLARVLFSVGMSAFVVVSCVHRLAQRVPWTASPERS